MSLPLPSFKDQLCLLVEDEPLIAMDLEDEIRAAGYAIRWAACVDEALRALDATSPSIAVLDVEARRFSSEAVAGELRRRQIPFIVYSGWNREEAPEGFQGAPWLMKPASSEALSGALAALRAGCHAGDLFAV